jgi:hypothetical protein
VASLIARVGGLSVALVATVALVVLGGDRRPPAGPAGPLALTAAWPDATVVDLPASLADGPAYSPVYFLDPATSFGTAPSPDGGSLRLLRRAADGSVRELRRLPIAEAPQFGGFVSDGTVLAWSESVTDARGRPRSQMWVADLAGDAPARRLTADTGEVVFFNSEHDLVLAGGALHWAAVAPGDDAATELRSVPLTGGPVRTTTEPGQWARSRWPYLVSAASGQSGTVAVRDPTQRRTVEVNASATELPTCSPTWCRVLLLGGDGPTRIDLMRPDGADRRRVAGGTASAALIDVAVLDRFEVLTQAGPEGPLASNQQLFLYDLTDRRTVLAAGSVGLVSYRAGVLWWSTGVDETTVWHALDLRTLAARG